MLRDMIIVMRKSLLNLQQRNRSVNELVYCWNRCSSWRRG